MIGFAVLMTGMEMMSGAVKPLANVPEFTNLLLMFTNPILGVHCGRVADGDHPVLAPPRSAFCRRCA